MAREGYPYILVLAVPALVALAASWFVAGAILAGLALFVGYFFRDPERRFDGGANHVASPADGRVVSVRQENGSEVLSIFLSVFDVHVNRAPVTGKISKIEYKRGKFLAAFEDRASSENEQNIITMDQGGRSVRFAQIAGVVARRIVCWRHEGDSLTVGDRIGLIKFGSRVDVFLPAGSRILVKTGERVRAGETVIGELP